MLEQNQNNETNTQYSLFGASTTKSTVHNGLLMISSHNPVGAANLTTASSSSSDLSSLIANNNNNFIAPSLPPLVQQKSQPQQPQQYLFNELSLNNSSSNSSSDRKKLFVGNLPPSTRLEDLVELFGRFGRVNEQLSVVKDDNYAFVHFYAEEAAELALRELNGTLFNKKYIRVQYSNSNGHIKKAVSSKCKSIYILLLLLKWIFMEFVCFIYRKTQKWVLKFIGFNIFRRLSLLQGSFFNRSLNIRFIYIDFMIL